MQKKNVFDVLKERGFVQQSTDENALRHLFNTQKVTGYIGFDATAKSFHIGSLVPMMALSWLQKLGQSGKKYVFENFAIEKQVGRLVNLYAESTNVKGKK